MIRQRESELLEALDNFVCKDPLSAGLIGEIMFIYHGSDNLKHFFSDFIGRSGIQPVIELVFENVQVSSTFDFIWNIIPYNIPYS